ncbi:MAG: Rrf2 family transcriptional regulator [bacterium]|nr:Rrf2 family transcriptional regulator [bacterium]
MISKKTKYGLQAVFYLAELYNKGPMLIADIAQNRSLPKKFLETILLELNKKGILHSQKGKGGGYSLKRNPNEIMVGEIIRVLEGPLAPVSCVSQTAYKKCEECMDEKACAIRVVMKEVRDAISNVLDRQSLAQAIVKRNYFLESSIINFTI